MQKQRPSCEKELLPHGALKIPFLTVVPMHRPDIFNLSFPIVLADVRLMDSKNVFSWAIPLPCGDPLSPFCDLRGFSAKIPSSMEDYVESRGFKLIRERERIWAQLAYELWAGESLEAIAEHITKSMTGDTSPKIIIHGVEETIERVRKYGGGHREESPAWMEDYRRLNYTRLINSPNPDRQLGSVLPWPYGFRVWARRTQEKERNLSSVPDVEQVISAIAQRLHNYAERPEVVRIDSVYHEILGN